MTHDIKTITAVLDDFGNTWSIAKDIIDLNITISQNDKGNTCNIVLADPTLETADRLIAHSLKNGGIVGLEPKENTSTDTNIPTAPDSSPVDPDGVSNPTNAQGWELAIVQGCVRAGITDPNQIAYVLATAWKETTMGADLVNESAIFEGRRDLGNNKPGDGKKYVPRGLVQVTGKTNYARVSKLVGADLIQNPKLLEQAQYAVPAICEGMKRGTFTGVKLGDFINGSKVDFYNARKIVNSLESAQIIADKAKNVYLPKVAGLLAKTNRSTNGLIAKTVAKSDKTPTTANTQTATAATTPGDSAGIIKGNKLTISFDDLSFIFYHQGTETSENGQTKVTGQGIRWVLNRRSRNKADKELKLSELASKIAKAHKVKLEYTATIDPYYEFVDQTGISDYQLLRRECERSGLFLSEVNGTLTIKSLDKVVDTSYVAVVGINLISYSIKDAAIDTYADDESSSRLQNEPKVSLNPLSGQFEQKVKDVDPVQDTSSTGRDKAKTGGKLRPGQEGTVNQYKARTKRVQGLPSRFTVPLTMETLALEPLNVVRTRGISSVFDRVWVIHTITHSTTDSTTKLDCYSPIEVADAGAAPPLVQSTANDSQRPVDAPKASLQGYIWGTTGIFTDGAGEASDPAVGRRARRHRGYDIAAPMGRPIVASKNGVVTIVANQPGGAGLWVRVQHDDGIYTNYFHMSQQNVKIGNQVRQGQVIGLVGDTGGSRGAHLHQEFWNSAGYLKCEKVGLSYKRGASV